MKVKVYNQDGKAIDEVSLPKEIFEVKLNTDLVHQAVVALSANKRQASAHTKDRSEVRGGGKKPWRQKGTGRARHGSIRSPLWKGGGITFGPRNEKIYTKDLPKKMRRKALLMVLSEKAKNDLIVVLDNVTFEKPRTKEMVKTISKLPCKNSNLLIAVPKYDKNVYLSARNIKRTLIQEARNLNVLDLLNTKYLLMTKESIKIIKATFTK